MRRSRLSGRSLAIRKKMNTLLSELERRTLERAYHDAATRQWIFVFSGRFVLQVSAPWRMVVRCRIGLGWQDDGHQFGLPKPVSAVERLEMTLYGKQVEATTVGACGDLVIRFPDSHSLEVFNASGGFEGWILNAPSNNPRGRYVVAQGGGTVIESHGDG
jgi:hypothetical protein